MKNIYIIPQNRTFIINSATVSCYKIMERSWMDDMFEVRADDKILGIYKSEKDALIALNDLYDALKTYDDGETKYMKPRNWEIFNVKKEEDCKSLEWQLIPKIYYE